MPDKRVDNGSELPGGIKSERRKERDKTGWSSAKTSPLRIRKIPPRGTFRPRFACGYFQRRARAQHRGLSAGEKYASLSKKCLVDERFVLPQKIQHPRSSGAIMDLKRISGGKYHQRSSGSMSHALAQYVSD